MRLPTLLLLLAGGVCAGAAAPASEKESIAQAQQELKDLRRRIDAAMAELRPMLDQMPDLERKFDAAQDDEAIQRLSKAELDPCWTRVSALGRLRSSFGGVEAGIERMQGSLIKQGGSGGLPNALADFAYCEGYWDLTEPFIRRALAAVDGVVKKRADAEARIAAAKAARKKSAALRRRLVHAAYGLVPLAVLAAGFLLWRRRRRAARRKTGPGKVFGDAYRVERELGRGSLGSVYEAVDLSLGRKVALKRLADAAKDPARTAAVLREAQAAAALKHPNIASLYTVVREEERIYLVLEFLQGRTLAEELAGRKKLNLRTAKGIVRQVAAALEHAHERGVLHRGLKPGDIMLLPDGAVKVMDFGIAAAAPPYMAPEQAAGGASKASDLYALGVCAREMLARGRSSPGLDAFLRRSLDPRAGLRFPSAAELAAAFAALPG